MRIELIKKMVMNALYSYRNFSDLLNPKNGKKSKKISKIILFSLLGLYFLFLSFNVFYGYLKMGNVSNLINESITFCFVLVTFSIFFFEATYLDSVLFFSKDIRLLKTLPLSYEEIFSSRIVVAYFYSFVTNIIFTIPLLVSITVMTGFSIYKLLISIILFFIIPIIPISLGSLISYFKLRIFKGKLPKSFDALISNVPFVLMILFFSRSSVELVNGIGEIESLSNKYGDMFLRFKDVPFFSNLSKSFFSLQNFLVVIVYVIVFLILFFLLIRNNIDKCYFYTLSENKKKKKRNEPNNKNSLILALVKREFNILNRDRAFIVEGIAEMFIPVILIVVWFVTGSLGDLNQLISSISNKPYFIIILLGVVELFSLSSLISSTSVSREGSLFKLNKILPITKKQIIFSKVSFHLLFISLIQIVYLIVFFVLFGQPINSLTFIIPLHILISIVVSLVGLFVDCSNPKLEWIEAKEAMKQNFNGLISMVINLVIVAVILSVLYFFNVILSIIFTLILIFLFYKLTYRKFNVLMS